MSLCMLMTATGIIEISAQSAQAFGTRMYMARPVQHSVLYRHAAANTDDAIAKPNTVNKLPS